MAVLTISRQYGSGGDDVASRVREQLGYRYFDKRLMSQVASEMGLSEAEIVDFTEDDYKARGFLERVFNRRGSRVVVEAGAWTTDTRGTRSVATAQLDEEWCIRMVKSTIRGAYKGGDVVIVGRGGQAILRDDPGVLHVRIEAPLSTRVVRVQAKENLTTQQAEDLIYERDRAAAAYLRRFYDIDWSSALLYHLVLNLGRWSVDQAAGMIAHAVEHLPAAEQAEPPEEIKAAA
jgi:cytidylate kinase